MNGGLFLTVRGIVQGVGFRPFVHRLASENNLGGWVRNTSGGVEILLEGLPTDLDCFVKTLKNAPPPMAVIEDIHIRPLTPKGKCNSFTIRPSHCDHQVTLIAPDTALCPDCRRELFSPKDRRYHYPFINCTNCGPRYTIVKALPYDRSQTVMNVFRMCPDCLSEYKDITNRRYHAEPNCCPTCGPQVFFTAGLKDSHYIYGPSALKAASQLLSQDKILAVKGIGGIHLACNANRPQAVDSLRIRKQRPKKPLAVMCRDLKTAARFCHISDVQARLLTSPRRPIVLLRKKNRDDFNNVAFGQMLGVMLPYTPVHELLMENFEILVMTSANTGGSPVLIDNDQALDKLKYVADGFLLNDRIIENRCDDSLVAVFKNHPVFIRKSRGYAPQPLTFHRSVNGICAFGAEQKGGFALGNDCHIFMSPHIGDLKNMETMDHYKDTMETYFHLFKIQPQYLVCDLHPDYGSTAQAEKYARQLGLPLLKVQHHWAHMAAGMADRKLSGTVFGIIWDGTGLGTDGNIWGCEFLEGNYDNFVRRGSIRPIPLPGGDRSTIEIGRIALSLFKEACSGSPMDSAMLKYIPLPESKIQMLEQLLDSGIACPGASSMGRLFDGVCALITGTHTISYDGEGPATLEALLQTSNRKLPQNSSYPLAFYMENNIRRFDWRPMIRAIIRDLDMHISPHMITWRFMSTLCHLALNQCQALNPEKYPVVLSGGVFFNQFLLSKITDLLTRSGFRVYVQQRTSPGDEGLALGQLAIAAAQRRNQYVSCHTNENQKYEWV